MNARTIQNAIIESYTIEIDRGCLLTMWLHLTYDGGGQSFGGWCLYVDSSSINHTIKSYAGHFIYRVLEIAGVEDVSKLPGKTIRVDGDWDHIYGIGHIIKNNWFYPKKNFKDEMEPKKEKNRED